jgi:hypothetical protein
MVDYCLSDEALADESVLVEEISEGVLFLICSLKTEAAFGCFSQAKPDSQHVRFGCRPQQDQNSGVMC